jgi:sec-independent protein translocase protein TatA
MASRSWYHGFGSVWHWVIVLLVVLVLFGRGRVSDMMGDFGKGIKSFKEGMADETDRPATPPGPDPKPRVNRLRLRPPKKRPAITDLSFHSSHDWPDALCCLTLLHRNFC